MKKDIVKFLKKAFISKTKRDATDEERKKMNTVASMYTMELRNNLQKEIDELIYVTEDVKEEEAKQEIKNLIEILDFTRARIAKLKEKYPSLVKKHNETIGGKLNAYREGDLQFFEVIKALDEACRVRIARFANAQKRVMQGNSYCIVPGKILYKEEDGSILLNDNRMYAFVFNSLFDAFDFVAGKRDMQYASAKYIKKQTPSEGGDEEDHFSPWNLHNGAIGCYWFERIEIDSVKLKDVPDFMGARVRTLQKFNKEQETITGNIIGVKGTDSSGLTMIIKDDAGNEYEVVQTYVSYIGGEF